MHRIYWALAVLVVPTVIGFATLSARADAPTIAADDRVLGKADAPITIFEYFSLTCPHCAEFERDSYPKLKAEWIDTGKAKLVYRDYPLDRNALKAAMLARCAPPERYAAFIEALFQTQSVWGAMDDPTPGLKRVALLGGIGEEKFTDCLNDFALSKSIAAEELEAKQKYGVDATPTFFINGNEVPGALPYNDFVDQLVKFRAALPGAVKAAAVPAPGSTP